MLLLSDTGKAVLIKLICGDEATFSGERPHLQLHDSEVVSFWEATVVESVAGAAATQVQILIHPKTKVTAAEKESKGKRLKWLSRIFFFRLNKKEYTLPASSNSKGVQVSFNKKGVISSPFEALQRKGRINHHKTVVSYCEKYDSRSYPFLFLKTIFYVWPQQN